ncbi:hypothetical protein NDU88_000345 [Pleurodeles waltl]|uniref:Secreted protein n=1 Tax=Pleurodeles waltl TaxID=8319 RepID=A0AAV7VWC0_PLEWA|nr:hypothetical protein NDU88_000345 [Pleurodeles waltl]
MRGPLLTLPILVGARICPCHRTVVPPLFWAPSLRWPCSPSADGTHDPRQGGKTAPLRLTLEPSAGSALFLPVLPRFKGYPSGRWLLPGVL